MVNLVRAMPAGTMRPMKNIVILISGRGSNMEAVIRAASLEHWPARIAAVISHRANASGLLIAAASGIKTLVVANQDYPNRTEFDAALLSAVDSFAPDLVVLAGFMRILTPAFVDHYAGRMLNIHPSLLPAFPGLTTHQRALDSGATEHGATVHFVTSELDHGPIVAQAKVPVLPGDTEAALSARVLEQEHIIYPRAIRWFIEGKLAIELGKVRLNLQHTFTQE